MVLKTQQFLNAMYGHNTGYNVISENGLTGWTTIYALTRALQIELGITSNADSFGPTTRTRFSQRFPNGIQQQADGASHEDNIYAIIQGALWCKGYSTGANGITKHFYGGTGGAVKSLKEDAGLIVPSSTVTLNVMIALLSMNQYVPLYLQGGTNQIRNIQQRLNNKYENYIGLAPCDGLYGREMNKALIIVLQAIEGLSVSQASGNFGATTISLLPLLPDTANKLTTQQKEEATYLIKYALCCNGYSVSLLSSNWDQALINTIKEFQNDMMLPANGTADTNTWMALLLSKGNPDRSSTACDTRFEITTSRLLQLKNGGYHIVGRYLTGTEFKVLRANEPKRILDNGLSFFPIFQESGTDITYFTRERGKKDALKAVRAARKFKIPEGNVIYFAVDLDPQNADITNYILPYFRELSNNMDKGFKTGVYGTRNVCTKVNQAGYAETSFVSDMSTGYSGNMGFKIPQNWTYDQFAEIPMSPDWAIDKCAYSGKFPPVTYLTNEVYEKPTKPSTAGITTIQSLIPSIIALELHYHNYYNIRFTDPFGNPPPPYSTMDIALNITNFFRSVKYKGTEWGITTLSPINTSFVNYVKDNDEGLYNDIYPYFSTNGNDISDGNDGLLDFAHLAATIECYISSPFVPDFWTGWGGDLATAMANTTNEKENSPHLTIQDIADSIVGSINSSFNYSDMCADADAIQTAKLVKASDLTTHAFSTALSDYYSSYVEKRYHYYVDDLNCPENLTALKEKIYEKMNGRLEKAPLVGLLKLKGNSPSDEVNEACCHSFAKYIYSELD